MTNFPTYTGTIYYPISQLTSINNNFTEKTLMELVIDDYGNGDYVNRKTEIGTFFDFIISSHPIFNKIDDVYNDKSYPEIHEETNTISYRYASDIYISGQTYFAKNPFSYDTSTYSRLRDNQTVQKRQLEKFIHDHSLEVHPIQNEDTCVQYGTYGWEKSASDEENPRVDTLSFVKFEKPSQICEIKNRGITKKIPFKYRSLAINLFSNAFVTIIGKISIKQAMIAAGNITKRTPYYTPENNLWVGLCQDGHGHLIAISELHNIEKGVAYFSFQLPLSKDRNYYLVTPFDVGSSDNSESENNDYDLFSKIPVNSAIIFYYTPAPNDSETPITLF